jgi:hypothetical protein
LVVKISRKKEAPFWGLGKSQLDILGRFGRYYVILLTSPKEGWILSDVEVQQRLRSGVWHLGGHDEYKVHSHLPEKNHFNSVEAVCAKLQ